MENSRFDARKTWRTIFLVLLDILTVNATAAIALWVSYEFNLHYDQPYFYLMRIVKLIPVFTVLTLVAIASFKLYNSLWEFASVSELWHIAFACVVAIVIEVIGHNVLARIAPEAALSGLAPMPKRYYIIHFFLLCLALGTTRFGYRVLRRVRHGAALMVNHAIKAKKRTMVIGAGKAGSLVIRELNDSELSDCHVVCVIDDSPSKKGSYIQNVKVVGNRDDIVDVAKEYKVEEIIFAIPTATAADKREIISICQKTGCTLQTVPGIYQLVNGEVALQKLRRVQVEDLLGRDAVKVNMDEILGYVENKAVLVTGGGGSIGSELCRQIAAHNPKRLVIFDIYENTTYSIQNEILKNHPDLKLEVLIGSVRDEKRVNLLFEKYGIDIVYHAAAHKHVPLMEQSPNEAIKNNVFGTYNVARAADLYGCEKFVMISTDKAVNPTNIMGASKRICEMIVQMFNARSKTEFVSVRFGNVLGSNGSVIPLFRKQIENGGPVTVTHKDIIRYFMTIPEAVSLVLQAGAFAKGGEIFVLDMGEPVRIDDLARNMIRLSGFEPDVDIKIQYTGLRPGEKLYEELLMSEEGLGKTDNQLIYVGHQIEFDEEVFTKQLEELRQACGENSRTIKELVEVIVPTYHITDNSELINGEAEKANTAVSC